MLIPSPCEPLRFSEEDLPSWTDTKQTLGSRVCSTFALPIGIGRKTEGKPSGPICALAAAKILRCRVLLLWALLLCALLFCLSLTVGRFTALCCAAPAFRHNLGIMVRNVHTSALDGISTPAQKHNYCRAAATISLCFALRDNITTHIERERNGTKVGT